LSSIAQINPTTWNAIAAKSSPFLRHEFLLALETSGCTTSATGWEPHHAVVSNATGDPVAFIPLYIKTNSYGEYVFDWSWADAYQSHGLQYYPKLLTAIPFTPSTSSRILTRSDEALENFCEQAVVEIQAEANRLGASSWHVLFPLEHESIQMATHNLSQRKGCQFQWFNRDYNSFDDFLSAMSSRKRKNIRKERNSVSAQGITFDVLEGKDITAPIWKHFYVFYQSTYLIRGREGYLNQDFFLQLGKSMPENLVMICASTDEQLIASALFFKGEDKLYGRYWGSLEDYQFLHFETCFYQGIEYCIHNNLKQFDAGAQGEHKIQRGFEPVETLSNHWIANEAFSDAIDDFLKKEEAYIDSYIEEARKLLPFKKT
jgi:predicted N-acyltransferase